MALRTDWKGVFVVAVTPFAADGEIDEAKFRRLMKTFVADGVHGVIVAGSTGEWYTMSDAELARLFAVARDEVGGKVKLLAGTSAIATRDAAARTAKAKELGFDGAMVLAPPYALPNERELLGHFEAVADVGLPLMLYNNPGRTQVNLTPALVDKMCAWPSVVAIKDSSKDVYELSRMIRTVGDRLSVFNGLEPYSLAMIGRGARGIVSMSANVIGKRAVAFYEHAAAGRWDEARKLEAVMDRLYEAFYLGGHGVYVTIKTCMNLVGRPGGYPRRPHLPIEAAGQAALRAILAEIGAPLDGQPAARAAE
ncbi:MAG: dihydrodipicolinate synthase family protein [Alphaproteobacteria bacterium]|nr:dihydrodipicolinate synthase family protein [Alphaproteobacteria bacterium]